MSTLRFIDAIRDGLDIELRRDPTVVVLGEDVTYGGPFGATKGLAEAYGARVKDTPISEATVVGLAVGAALSGLRPVVEVMYIDFITLAMDQLVNHGAKLRYMTDGLLRAPMVIRAQGSSRVDGRPSLPEPRGVVRPRPGHDRGRAVHAGGRPGPAPERHPRR